MKKIIPVPLTSWLLSISVLLTVLTSGCATPERHAFNQDFGENLPVKPMYYIQEKNEQRFTITVQQGKPTTSAERVLNLKEAATTIAKAQCQKLGWKKWQLNYIQERDQGWMHVVIAEVVREPFVEPTFPQSGSQP